jgi:hypothetical protein
MFFACETESVVGGSLLLSFLHFTIREELNAKITMESYFSLSQKFKNNPLWIISYGVSINYIGSPV